MAEEEKLVWARCSRQIARKLFLVIPRLILQDNESWLFFAGQVWNNISQNIVRNLSRWDPDNCSGVNWWLHFLHIPNKKFKMVDFLFNTISADTVCQFDTIKIHGEKNYGTSSCQKSAWLPWADSFVIISRFLPRRKWPLSRKKKSFGTFLCKCNRQTKNVLFCTPLWNPNPFSCPSSS